METNKDNIEVKSGLESLEEKLNSKHNEVKLIGLDKSDESIEIKIPNSSMAYGINIINADSVWKKGFRGEGIKIAVIDSGCDINHLGLKDKIMGGRNFTLEDGGDLNKYGDYNGHGTHVAGIIVDESVGIAPKAKLLILKVLDKYGRGSVSGLLGAIEYAILEGVDIISMSLGSKYPMDEVHEAILRANSLGISVVCAAGNEGDNRSETTEISYPGGYNEVISVGAVDRKMNVARFSNSNKEIDLVAPGVSIISSFPNNRYISLSGTSMATPFISGALALLIQWSTKEFGRKLSEVEIYGQLMKNTHTLDAHRSVQGNGLVYLKV